MRYVCLWVFAWEVSIEIMPKVKNAIVDSLNFLWARTNESSHKYTYTTFIYNINICKAKSIYMRTGVFHPSLRPPPPSTFLRLIHNSSFEIDWCWKLFFSTDTLLAFFYAVSWYIACLRILRNWTIFYTIAIATGAAAAAASAYGWRNCELKQNFKFILHRIVDKGKLKREKNNHENGNWNQFICGSEKINGKVKWVSADVLALVMSFQSTYNVQSLVIAWK